MACTLRSLNRLRLSPVLVELSSKYQFGTTANNQIQDSTSAASRTGGIVRRQEDKPSVSNEPPASDWVPVVHKETGLTYWWRPSTGETTALGEPMPGPGGRRQPVPVVQGGTSLLGLFAAGAGIGLVFALLGRLL
eukprot:jgi/Botrbrau1/15429/Bobra.43_2s0055.1